MCTLTIRVGSTNHFIRADTRAVLIVCNNSEPIRVELQKARDSVLGLYDSCVILSCSIIDIVIVELVVGDWVGQTVWSRPRDPYRSS